MKRKLFFVVLAVIACFAFTACADDGLPALMPADKEAYASDVSGTPEALAKMSSQVYLAMVNGDLPAEDGFETLVNFSASSSAEQMQSLKSEFKKQIEQTKEYLDVNDDSVTGYAFSKTEYLNDDEAKILRIQTHKNGKQYYFQQDFVKENGEWKIKGDNIADPFRIKSMFLWWYV